MTSIEIDGLGKRYGAQEAVVGLTMRIPSRAFLVLLGPSGCGKSTTLRMLAGLEDPSSGRISFGGRVIADGALGTSVAAQQRGAGMVFQSYALWPHMTVRQNVEWPLAVAGWSRNDRRARVSEVLASLEIEQLADRIPARISGGQQQRVAIARTIAPRPSVVLFDEPLSNLDARLRVETRAELGRIHRESDSTSVYVTHDQIEALALATHIAVMNGGRLEQFGTPEELLEHPATVFVASFLGSPPAVLLPVSEQGGSLCFDGVPVAPASLPGTAATVSFRPQDLVIDGAGSLELAVAESTPQAGGHLVSGELSNGAGGPGRRVTLVSGRRATPGSRVRVGVSAAPSGYFGADGRRL